MIRLVGGSWSGEGRVEVFHNGAWGTVCDDHWDLNDAQVVCRSLGYSNASDALMSAHFGQGSGQIWLDDVNCLGHESSIERCSHIGWNIHNCNHGEDASVICSSKYEYKLNFMLMSGVCNPTRRLHSVNDRQISESIDGKRYR